MRKAHPLAVLEVLLASIVASTANFVLTLQMMKRYFLTIYEFSLKSAAQCLFALIVWLSVLLWVRHLPHRFFLMQLRERKLKYLDFDSYRRHLEQTGWTILSGAIALVGLLLIMRPVWDSRPLLLGLPLVWLLGLRKLLALPEPTDKRYRLNGDADLSGIIPSQELSEAEIDEEASRDAWRRR
jgi:hypothetical protein